MRIAILSDIHSNLAALEAVIRKMDDLGISNSWCLGDIVGYGPFPNECLEIVRARCSLVVTGNHDSGVVGVTPVDDFNEYGLRAIYWTRGAMTAEHLEYLRGLPLSLTHESCTLVHASPFEAVGVALSAFCPDRGEELPRFHDAPLFHRPHACSRGHR